MSPIDIRDRLDDRFRILTASQHMPRNASRRCGTSSLVATSCSTTTSARSCATPSVFQGGFDLAVDHRGDRRDRRARRAGPDRLAGAQVACDRERLAGPRPLRAPRDHPAVRRGRARRRRLTRRGPRPSRGALRRRVDGAAGSGGTGRSGSTASTGSRPSSRTCARHSGGVGRAAIWRRRPTSPHTQP